MCRCSSLLPHSTRLPARELARWHAARFERPPGTEEPVVLIRRPSSPFRACPASSPVFSFPSRAHGFRDPCDEAMLLLRFAFRVLISDFKCKLMRSWSIPARLRGPFFSTRNPCAKNGSPTLPYLRPPNRERFSLPPHWSHPAWSSSSALARLSARRRANHFRPPF